MELFLTLDVCACGEGQGLTALTRSPPQLGPAASSPQVSNPEQVVPGAGGAQLGDGPG